jgi:hypothetical protein
MSTGKEYNELILDLLKEQGKDISDIKEDIAELKTARHVIKEHKEWKREVTDVWSPPQMKEVKDEVYVQKSQWSKTIGILIGVEVVVGVVIGIVMFIFK